MIGKLFFLNLLHFFNSFRPHFDCRLTISHWKSIFFARRLCACVNIQRIWSVAKMNLIVLRSKKWILNENFLNWQKRIFCSSFHPTTQNPHYLIVYCVIIFFDNLRAVQVNFLIFSHLSKRRVFENWHFELVRKFIVRRKHIWRVYKRFLFYFTDCDEDKSWHLKTFPTLSTQICCLDRARNAKIPSTSTSSLILCSTVSLYRLNSGHQLFRGVSMIARGRGWRCNPISSTSLHPYTKYSASVCICSHTQFSIQCSHERVF